MPTTTMNKVAAITWVFWVLKIIATTLGETSGDLLSLTLGLGYVVALAITGTGFVVILVGQLAAPRFIPALYWATILATTMLGTEISDAMDRTLGLGYPLGATLLAAWLGLSLLIWRIGIGRLQVHPIGRLRVETLYWLTILAANSLGTAFGDFLSDTLLLGYLSAALVTAGVIGLVALLHRATRLPDVLLFWLAFVFTRPFGATFGDLLTKPGAHGGLGLSTGLASAVALALAGAIILLCYHRGRS